MVTVREWWEYRLFRFGEKNDHGAGCADVAGGDGGCRCGLSGFVPGRENEKTHGSAGRAGENKGTIQDENKFSLSDEIRILLRSNSHRVSLLSSFCVRNCWNICI